jgi:hypothetical protein
MLKWMISTNTKWACCIWPALYSISVLISKDYAAPKQMLAYIIPCYHLYIIVLNRLPQQHTNIILPPL